MKVTRPIIGEKLKERGLLRVYGEDVVQFLHGLITNDMGLLRKGSPAMYSMFLNKPGRVLYDAIIYRTSQDDTYLVECDKSVSNELRRHLRLYRVRRKVEVDVINSDFNVWVIFNNPPGDILSEPALYSTSVEGSVALKLGDKKAEPNDFPEEVIICKDPRLKALGTRVVVPSSFDIVDVNRLFADVELNHSEAGNSYKLLRYKLGVGEGVIDHPPLKCFPFESNLEYLHGISFHKGCYLGQEFTARTYHTGVVRKRLMTVYIPHKVDKSSLDVQTPNGKVVGKLRGIEEKYGLAILRVDSAQDSMYLQVDNTPCKVKKPYWWPIELPERVAANESIT